MKNHEPTNFTLSHITFNLIVISGWNLFVVFWHVEPNTILQGLSFIQVSSFPSSIFYLNIILQGWNLCERYFKDSLGYPETYSFHASFAISPWFFVFRR
jgi:hypothetical protein